MITNRVIHAGNGRRYTEKIINSDLRTLVNIMNQLRGANGSRFHSLNGMFWRSYDFELSTKAVKYQLHHAQILAEQYKEKGYDTDDFKNHAENGSLTLHSRSKNSFSTVSLGVALRHFVNDTCRVLEPSAQLLELKTQVQKENPKNSLNTYIKQLDRKKVAYGFDGSFFIALYEEIWNDYKHRESSGISAGGFSVQEDNIVHPTISGNDLAKFKNKGVEEFVDETLMNVQKFVEFVK